MKTKHNRAGLLLLVLACITASSCTQMKSSKVILTSAAGDVLAEKENIVFTTEKASGLLVSVDLENKRQLIDGIGSSLTESSAYVLACVSPEKRREILEELFGESGANFPITRTHIASCDFSVEGKYTYSEVAEDMELEHFTLDPDKEGFSKEKYPYIKDESYDHLPLIQEVLEIKKAQADSEFRVVASPWTAPPWMKDNNAYFEPGYGGALKKENYGVFADYFIRYFEEMKNEGIDIWGITPVNEPFGNNGSWESMHMSPEEQAEFVGKYLGPAMEKSEFEEIKIFGYDQNRQEMPEWADALYGEPEYAKYFEGLGIHWYGSTYLVFEDILEEVHNNYPSKSIIHTEGCVDNLGLPAPDGVGDPEGWQEEGWFKDDAWWWEKNASDWGYTAPWGSELQTLYAPTHRYARNIIVSINNWMTGFIDWNVVLDSDGGPNHVGNFCGAPVMIDIENEDVYYTPVYHVLKHFSKTIRPGDVALKATPVEGEYKDKLYVGAILNQQNEVVVSMLNVTDSEIEFNLKLDNMYAKITVPENSLQTVITPLNQDSSY